MAYSINVLECKFFVLHFTWRFLTIVGMFFIHKSWFWELPSNNFWKKWFVTRSLVCFVFLLRRCCVQRVDVWFGPTRNRFANTSSHTRKEKDHSSSLLHPSKQTPTLKLVKTHTGLMNGRKSLILVQFVFPSRTLFYSSKLFGSVLLTDESLCRPLIKAAWASF